MAPMIILNGGHKELKMSTIMNLKMRVSIQNGARPLANFEGWN